MKTSNLIKVELEGFSKCHVLCDLDCPIGSLYDFACTFQSFVAKRIKEAEEQNKPSQPDTSKEIIPE